MTELELLAELIDDLARDLRPVIEPLTTNITILIPLNLQFDPKYFNQKRPDIRRLFDLDSG